MKEIVVLSGKGGTGKTSITASLAYLAMDELVLADADVDAADMHLIMQPDFHHKEDFMSGTIARILPESCTGCGLCAGVCHFDAIEQQGDSYSVDPFSCEGCSYCSRVCPAGAIVNEEALCGELYRSRIVNGGYMSHARLGIGGDNSGKLVARVKEEARQMAEHEEREIILVDGSPGIGCPVISSLSGASLVLLVVEPSISGIHDLKRIHQLLVKFSISTVCLINKSDIHAEKNKEIKEYLRQEEIPLLGEIAYTHIFSEALHLAKTVAQLDPGIRNQLTKLWQDMKFYLK